MCEKPRVPLGLAQDAAERRLGQLVGGVEVVLDLENGPQRVDDPEVDHRIDTDRDIVARDQILGRNVIDVGAQTDPHHPVDGPEDQDQPRALGLLQHPPEAEDHAALVLVEDPTQLRKYRTTSPRKIPKAPRV